MDFKEEILKSIQIVTDRGILNNKADRTYRAVINGVVKKGYVITDIAGSERTVPCCIPNVTLRPGQTVWVKEPMGDLRGLHICGIC